MQYKRSKLGTVLKGCKIYVPWIPCADCARAIKFKQDFGSYYLKIDKISIPSIQREMARGSSRTLTMFEEANVKVRWV
jgi:deoxycytidylate deaminase